MFVLVIIVFRVRHFVTPTPLSFFFFFFFFFFFAVLKLPHPFLDMDAAALPSSQASSSSSSSATLTSMGPQFPSEGSFFVFYRGSCGLNEAEHGECLLSPEGPQACS